MVAGPLRLLLLRGEGAGELAGEGVGTGRAEHPVCGDEVVMHVRVAAGALTEVRWQAAACPAATAVAALAAAVLPGAPVGEIGARLRAAIAAHGGLDRHERHAEAIVLRALLAAAGAN